jgi:HMGL-like
MQSFLLKSRKPATNLQVWKSLMQCNVHRRILSHGCLVRCPQVQSYHQLLNLDPRKQWFSTESSSKRPEVSIVEVGPRDGLQNESQIVSADDKIKLIEMLIEAGCRRIEVGALVHPTLVPNMANSLEVMKRLHPLKKDDVHFSCLIPKSKYLDAIVDTPVNEIAIFASATETFSQKVSARKEMLFCLLFMILNVYLLSFSLSSCSNMPTRCHRI